MLLIWLGSILYFSINCLISRLLRESENNRDEWFVSISHGSPPAFSILETTSGCNRVSCNNEVIFNPLSDELTSAYL